MNVTLNKTKPSKKLEKHIQAKIVKYLKTVDGWSGDVITKGMYGGNGIADIIGCYNSQYVAIEVKRPGQKPTPIQAVWLNTKKRSGAIIGVAESIDYVKIILDSIP